MKRKREKKKKKRGGENLFVGVASVMPAKEHDNTSSYDVEPSPLLSEDSSKSFVGQPSLGASHGGTAHLHDLLLDLSVR